MPDRYQDEIEEILKGFNDNQESLPTDTLDSGNDSADSNDYLVDNTSDDGRGSCFQIGKTYGVAQEIILTLINPRTGAPPWLLLNYPYADGLVLHQH